MKPAEFIAELERDPSQHIVLGNVIGPYDELLFMEGDARQERQAMHEAVAVARMAAAADRSRHGVGQLFRVADDFKWPNGAHVYMAVLTEGEQLKPLPTRRSSKALAPLPLAEVKGKFLDYSLDNVDTATALSDCERARPWHPEVPSPPPRGERSKAALIQGVVAYYGDGEETKDDLLEPQRAELEQTLGLDTDSDVYEERQMRAPPPGTVWYDPLENKITGGSSADNTVYDVGESIGLLREHWSTLNGDEQKQLQSAGFLGADVYADDAASSDSDSTVDLDIIREIAGGGKWI